MSIDVNEGLTSVPGRHARAIVLRLRMRTLLTLGALAVLTTLAGREFGFHSTLFMGLEVALLVTILLVYRYVLPLVDRHDRGAAGEEHVGGLLDGLPAPWIVVHDLCLAHGDVDHLVIGPPGVFSVETKSHPGPIHVERLHGGLLRQARAQRDVVERALGLPVQPLLVFSRAWVDRPLARRKGVCILPSRMLLRHLAKCPVRLDAPALEEVCAKAFDLARAQDEHDGQLRSRLLADALPAGARDNLLAHARSRLDHT